MIVKVLGCSDTNDLELPRRIELLTCSLRVNRYTTKPREHIQNTLTQICIFVKAEIYLLLRGAKMKFQKYTFDQWIIVIAATLFMIGAVLMIINVFGAQNWALWTGFALAVIASALVVWGWLMHNRKMKAKSANLHTESPETTE